MKAQFRGRLLTVLTGAWAVMAVCYVLRCQLSSASSTALHKHLEVVLQRQVGGARVEQIQQGGSTHVSLPQIEQQHGGSTHISQPSGPLKSRLACEGEQLPGVTARELDLQQQRRCVLQAAGGRPEGGYLAACLAVKDQHRDLPEWLEYHLRLGVSKFYIMDGGSSPPLDDVLQPYVQSGRVVHRLMGNATAAAEELRNATCNTFHPRFKQLLAYSACVNDYGTRHQWMAFIDTDEFLVPAFGTGNDDLPTLLREYEAYGGLAVNWRMFGSGGHKKRQNSTLLAYIKCYAKEEEENQHIKTIANMALMTRTGGPHHATYAPGHYAVSTGGVRVDGPRSAKVDYSRLVLHHYVTKSLEDYQDKLARGSGMGNKKTMEFWNRVQNRAVKTCRDAVDLLARWRSEDSAGNATKGPLFMSGAAPLSHAT